MDMVDVVGCQVVEPTIVLYLDVPQDVVVKRLKEEDGAKIKGMEGILKHLEGRRRDLDPVVEYYTKRHKLQTIPSDDTTEGMLCKP
jgi:adenylate kinase family enzyme